MSNGSPRCQDPASSAAPRAAMGSVGTCELGSHGSCSSHGSAATPRVPGCCSTASATTSVAAATMLSGSCTWNSSPHRFDSVNAEPASLATAWLTATAWSIAVWVAGVMLQEVVLRLAREVDHEIPRNRHLRNGPPQAPPARFLPLATARCPLSHSNRAAGGAGNKCKCAINLRVAAGRGLHPPQGHLSRPCNCAPRPT